MALQKSFSTAKRAAPEATQRDVIKQMKNGLSDKSLAVQRGAAQVRISSQSLDFSDEVYRF